MTWAGLVCQILFAAWLSSATSIDASRRPEATCSSRYILPECELVGSLLQSSRSRIDEIASRLSGGLLADTGAAAPPDASALQVGGLAGAEASASIGTSGTDTLLAQIRKQAENAVSSSQELPESARDLLSNFSVNVDGMVEDLLLTHNASQEEIYAAYASVEACEEHWYKEVPTIDAQNSTTEASEIEHAECHNSLLESSSTVCDQLQDIVEAMINDPLDCRVPEPRLEAECVAAPTIRPFIESVKEWAQGYRDEYTHHKDACKAALEDATAGRASCETLQGRYEGEFCTLSALVNVTIQSYESCRATEIAGLEVVVIKNHTNEINKNEYIALMKIDCYLDVLLLYGVDQLDAQREKLTSCNEVVVDTSMFDLDIPDEVEALNFTNVTSLLTPEPGDEEWLALYDEAWGITEAVSPCVIVA